MNEKERTRDHKDDLVRIQAKSSLGTCRPRHMRKIWLFVCFIAIASIYVWHTRSLMILMAVKRVDESNKPLERTKTLSTTTRGENMTRSETEALLNTTVEDEPSMQRHKTITLVETTHSDMNTTNNTLSAELGVARYPNGTLGYIADPTSLRKSSYSFLAKSLNSTNITRVILEKNPQLYWKLLVDYESQYRSGTYSGSEILDSEYICAAGPGRGFEEEYGYKLLTEKIQIRSIRQSPKILCLVYTYPKMRDLLRVQALSWAWKCNGYLAFSTETIPTLGLVDLVHPGDESYQNMWQKVRSIWMYVYNNYRHEYDFFHLGGDDLYVMVDNMRRLLSDTVIQRQNMSEPIYLGQWIPQDGGEKYSVSGGPGYTLNRAALTAFVEQALPSCRSNMRVSHEDRFVSECLRDIGIVGGDTRDYATGEQLYHEVGPAHLYSFRSTTTTRRRSFHAKAAAYWETLPLPNSTSTSATTPVGPKHGLDSVGAYSVTFHNIYHPLYMARLHSILFPGTCPADSPLGRALGAYNGE